MDSKQLAAQVRLDGIRAGLQRIRVAFLATNVAAAAMFISGWNTYLSRTRDFLTAPELSGNSFVAAVQRESIAQALQGEVVTVALLGIRVRVVDFAVLGSLGMLMCACWMFLGLRGYHSSVGELLDDTRADKDPEFRRWIAHGIDSFLVFSVLRPGTPSGCSRLASCLSRILWYIPAIIIGLIVCADVYAAFLAWPSPGTVSHVLKTARELHPVSFYCSESAAILCGILTFLLCRKVASDDASSNGCLQKYYAQISATAP